MDDDDEFDFNQWLDTNNISRFKEIFVKHNMTTFDSISTSNSKFASLISEQAIIESNNISSLVLAIQKLHFNPNTLPDADGQESEPEPEVAPASTMFIPPIPDSRANSPSLDKQIIVVH